MVNKDILNNIKDLQKKIEESYCRHRILVLEVEYLERMISDFTEYYYSKVGYLAPRMKCDTKDNNTEVENPQHDALTFYQTEDLQVDYVNLGSENRENFVNNELKNIYRKLVRLCHPDTLNVRGDEKEVFYLVNEAYVNKNLVELIKLEKILCESEEDRQPYNYNVISKLRKEYASIVNEIDKLEVKQYNLLHSSANVLRNRVIIAKIQGYDLIDEIKQEMLKSI